MIHHKKERRKLLHLFFLFLLSYYALCRVHGSSSSMRDITRYMIIICHHLVNQQLHCISLVIKSKVNLKLLMYRLLCYFYFIQKFHLEWKELKTKKKSACHSLFNCPADFISSTPATTTFFHCMLMYKLWGSRQSLN